MMKLLLVWLHQLTSDILDKCLWVSSAMLHCDNDKGYKCACGYWNKCWKEHAGM